MKQIDRLSALAGEFPRNARVVVHTACAAPPLLSEQLVSLAREQGPFELFDLTTIGTPRFLPGIEDDSLRLSTFVPGKAVRSSTRAGNVHVFDRSLSSAPRIFSQGEYAPDILLLQVSPPGADGKMSLGISVDVIRAALACNPIVIAEINPLMPRTHGDTAISADEIDFFIEGGAPPQTVRLAQGDATDNAIADHIAGLIRSGDVLQTGIGAVPDLTVMRLTHLSDLGIHTGIITEAIQPLIERGVVTNATKSRFRGRSVATMAAGSAGFYHFLHDNHAIEFYPCDLTHAADTLAAIPQLCAINGALEIDLQGSVNAEMVDGRRISAPGGQPDFASGAVMAPGGKSIIALRAASKDGQTSRVVPALTGATPRTTHASQVTHVVTEFGVAAIAGLSGAALARALAGIAAPEFRGLLGRAKV